MDLLHLVAGLKGARNSKFICCRRHAGEIPTCKCSDAELVISAALSIFSFYLSSFLFFPSVSSGFLRRMDLGRGSELIERSTGPLGCEYWIGCAELDRTYFKLMDLTEADACRRGSDQVWASWAALGFCSVQPPPSAPRSWNGRTSSPCMPPASAAVGSILRAELAIGIIELLLWPSSCPAFNMDR